MTVLRRVWIREWENGALSVYDAPRPGTAEYRFVRLRSGPALHPAEGRCRDCVGKFVRLRREVRTRGGVVFAEGARMRVTGTWRGTFTLQSLDAPRRFVRQVSRRDFVPEGS